MYRLLTLTIFCCLSVFATNGQVLISEIMYNPPEAGTDSLEYIELYNPGSESVDITGYFFSMGVEYTFPDTSIASGSYLLVAVNSAAIQNTLGISALQWTAGALRNGGEKIELSDAGGNLVDEVDYGDTSPWPSSDEGTDGEGASIEFCIDEDDNSMGENWRASTAETGITLNGRSFLGSPGSANSADCSVPTADYIVTVTSNVFTPADLTIDVGESVLWKNEDGFHNVNGTIETYPNNPEGFTSGSAASAPWQYEFTFTKEGVYNYQCDPHVSLGMVGTITVISGVNYKDLTIEEARETDADGVPTNIDSTVRVRGIGYGINYRPDGLQFTIIDNENNGINVFNFSNESNYQFAEGDSLEVRGVLSQFNGLAQISMAEVSLLSSGNDLILPALVDSLSEETESSLIKIENVSLVDSNQWTNSGSAFEVEVTNGSDTFVVVIDDEVSILYEGAYATGTFDVTGIGGQFDTSNPFTSGYRIIPRYAEDISPYVPAEPNFAVVTIGEASATDENGVAMMLGDKVEIKGITYGINYRPSGLQFTIIDESNDGIGLFLNTGNLGYEFAEGDEVAIQGTIGQFNGLTQIEPESISLLSSGNELAEPTVVTELGENTESRLIRLEAVKIVDLSDWAGNGGSFNVDIETSAGTILTLRIDGDTDLASTQLPGTTLTITGLGGQFDTSEPYLSGYQILPRYMSDVLMVSNVEDIYLSKDLVHLYPNPSSSFLNIETGVEVEKIHVFDVLGRRILSIGQSVSTIDVSSLASGQYYLHFVAEKGVVQKAFLKE